MKKVWITAYDVFSAKMAENAGVDAILVGDSLGMTVYGFKTTQEVTKELMLQHFIAVKKSAPHTRCIIDIPYQCDIDPITLIETLEFFSEKGATEFKLELTDENFHCFFEARARGFSFVIHLGYLPQHEKIPHVFGKSIEEAKKIKNLAKKAKVLGVSSFVLECVPEWLAKEISDELSSEVIGIGAGRYTDGQILVFDDIVGKTSDSFTPKFLRRFGNVQEEYQKSLASYLNSVRFGEFPSEEEVYF